MENWLVLMSIVFPIIVGILILVSPKPFFRNLIILAASVLLIAVSLSFTTFFGQRMVDIGEIINFNMNEVITILDFALMLYILFIGVRLKSWLISILAVIQMLPLGYLEFGFGETLKNTEAVFRLDGLSIIMVLVISIIGSLISIFAIGYMKNHESHLKLQKSKQSKFFSIIFLFLGAMNGLVLTDNLLWMSFFWEITTLCSFLLIAHDGNEISIKNATRALWINLLGGIAFLLGTIVVFQVTNQVRISTLIEMSAQFSEVKAAVGVGIALLCFAGLTKSAQLPFQSWLLGAMVAPTPVSALLHSSTMVKAGVYLIVRLAPAFSGTTVGFLIAIIGGFTFMTTSMIAISQSNAKRVLAYSTIANLGLIVACAGMGSSVAIGAAILLIVFHAVSKALMFLCVGTIEQNIESRDIEDMEGIFGKMPFTATVAAIGAASMLLPPFGVLVSKWLAIEAASRMPAVLIMLVLGSALTAVFWIKFIGKLITNKLGGYRTKFEKLHWSVFSVLSILLIFVILASICIVPIFNIFISPDFMTLEGFRIMSDTGLIKVVDENDIGGFPYLSLFIILTIIGIATPFFIRRVTPERIRQPYLCGENMEIDGDLYFRGEADKKIKAVFGNYYLQKPFGEGTHTLWLTIAGVVLIIGLLTASFWR